MKRSTKILTVLLAASLLFGMGSALVASADEAAGATNVLNVTNHDYNAVDECNNGVKGTEYIISGTGDTQFFGLENSVKSKYMSASHEKEAGRDNTYARIHYTPGALESETVNVHREASLRWRAHTKYDSKFDLKNHSYLSLDFDLAADRYVYTYTLDGVTGYKTATSNEEFAAFINSMTGDKAKAKACIEEAVATRELSFPNNAAPLGMNFQFLTSKVDNPASTLVSSTNANWLVVSKAGLSVVKNTEGNWSLKGIAADGKTVYYELSNKISEFDHVTVVFKVLDGGLAVQPHIYVNGEYMLQLPNWAMNGESAKYNVFYQIAFTFAKNVGEGNISDKMYDRYSFALDNVALNYYDFADAEVAGGLAEFMASSDYKTKEAIMECTNVVYNNDYYTPGASLRAVINHDDGTTVDCYTKNSLIKSVRNGDFVDIMADVENFNPSLDFDVVTFTTVNGSTVSLSREAQENFKLQHTQRQIDEETTVDIYTVCYGKNDVTVKWMFDGAYGNAESGKEQKLLPGQPLATNLKITAGLKTNEDGVIMIGSVKNWYWDYDENGEISDADFLLTEKFGEAMTRAEIIEQYIDKGITEIVMIPEIEYSPIQFVIMINDGETSELYAPDYDFGKFADTTKLASSISKLEKGKNYTVTLYSDITLGAFETISLPKDITLNFDLNGYKISQSASESFAVFTLNNGVTFNLYSDKAGASVSGTTLVTSNNIEKATINLGKITETDAMGDNLTMYGSSIVYLKGSETKTDAVKALNVNINGGNYYGTVASNGALFPIADVDMKLTVKNADIITANGEAIFSVIDSYAASADISVEKSNLFAGEINEDYYEVGTLINGWNIDSKMYIKDSVVLGFKNKSNVTLGSGNKINATLDKGIACESGALIAYSNNGMYLIESLISVPGAEAITQNFEITLITFTAEAIEDCVKLVKWLTPDGNIYNTAYWVAGSEVELFESLNDFAPEKLNNGWFDVKYDAWMNTTEGVEDVDDFTVLNKENTFAPKPTYVANVNTVKVGVSVYDNLAYNIYVPTPVVDTYEMSFLGFFDANGKIELNVYNNVALDGVAGWNRLIGLFANGEFAAKTIKFRYSVNGQVLEASVNIDVFNYAYRVDSQYGCGSDESKLVYAMMQYNRSIFEATNEDEDLADWFNAEWAKYMVFHDENCDCQKAVEYTAPTTTANDSAISALVSKYSFALVVDENDNVSFAFSLFLKNAATVKINGATVTAKENGEYVLTGIELADLADDITIEIGGVSGTYSLANYVKANETDFTKALYVLAVNAQ